MEQNKIDEICKIAEIDDIGELSDGYHTFNSLYHQRAILFAALVNAYSKNAWKSRYHENGEKCFDSDNWFIVGIDTPEGSYTYHYEMGYWDLFKCKEIEFGKRWDGHTEKDVKRLLSLNGVNLINEADYKDAVSALKELTDYFLGENWYISDPVSAYQGNALIVEEIKKDYKGYKKPKKTNHRIIRREGDKYYLQYYAGFGVWKDCIFGDVDSCKNIRYFFNSADDAEKFYRKSLAEEDTVLKNCRTKDSADSGTVKRVPD